MTAAAVADTAADTSVVVAAHVEGHQHHRRASHAAAECSHVLGIVLTEAWSVLRRHFQVPASDTARMLRAYATDRQVVPAPTSVFHDVLNHGADLRLGGNVHDFLIVRTAAAAGLRLVTFDRGMERLDVGEVERPV